MAVIGKITQQPADKIDYDIDLLDFTTTGDTVATALVTVSPVGLPVTSVLNGAHTTLKVWVGPGGTNGVTYKIEVTISTTNGRIKQDELRVKIKEV